MAGIFGGGDVPLSGTDPIAPWGGYSGNQITGAWGNIPTGGDYGGGGELGVAPSPYQEPLSLWDRLKDNLGSAKPEDLAKKAQELMQPAQAPTLSPATAPHQAAQSMNPYHNIYSRLPLDPKTALALLMKGG